MSDQTSPTEWVPVTDLRVGDYLASAQQFTGYTFERVRAIADAVDEAGNAVVDVEYGQFHTCRRIIAVTPTGREPQIQVKRRGSAQHTSRPTIDARYR